MIHLSDRYYWKLLLQLSRVIDRPQHIYYSGIIIQHGTTIDALFRCSLQYINFNISFIRFVIPVIMYIKVPRWPKFSCNKAESHSRY